MRSPARVLLLCSNQKIVPAQKCTLHKPHLHGHCSTKFLYIFITSGNCQTTDVSQLKSNRWSLGSLITGRGETPLTLTETVVINLALFGQLKPLALWKQQLAFLTDHWVRLQGNPKRKWIPRRQDSRSGKQVVWSSSYAKQIIFLNNNS